MKLWIMKETTYSSNKPEQGFSNYCIGTPKIPKKSTSETLKKIR